MHKKCGCCLSDPFGAPRENCTFCDGSGIREVIEAESEVELRISLAWGQKSKTEEYEKQIQIASAAQASKKAAEYQKKKDAVVNQIKEREERRLIERKYFEPSPRMGTYEYEYVIKKFSDRLFICLSCGYKANLYKNLPCGNCGLKHGYNNLKS